MRCFVAVELPRELTDALVETQATLRDALRGTYVGPDRLHVTLAFLGDVAGSRLTAVSDAVERAAWGTGPIECTLGPLGSFGRRSQAVVWQGFDRGADELCLLAERVRSELGEAGFSFDTKRFVPHVTLMRRADLTAADLGIAQVATGTIDCVTVFSSDLSGPHPVYEALDRIPLVGHEN